MTTHTELLIFEVKRACAYISDDGYLAGYFGIPREIIENVRAAMPKPKPITEHYVCTSSGSGLSALAEAEKDARSGSKRLNEAIQGLFQRWEDENGFRPGAAQLLLPAGWSEKRQSVAA